MRKGHGMNHDFKTDINWQTLRETRTKLGGKFYRHFGYFTDDGPRSIQAIENAMRAMNAAKMVLPANRLAEDAFLFGAVALGELAEGIERQAQECVSLNEKPDTLLRDVLALRPLYFNTVARIEREISPLVGRKGRATLLSRRRTTVHYV